MLLKQIQLKQILLKQIQQFQNKQLIFRTVGYDTPIGILLLL